MFSEIDQKVRDAYVWCVFVTADGWKCRSADPALKCTLVVNRVGQATTG